MYTKDNLLFITQLELLYKSCLLTLREQNIEYDEKHERLSDAIPDHDSVDLLDTIEILHTLLLNDKKYEEQKEVVNIIVHAKQHVNNIESLDVLEEQLNFTELEQEMGTDIMTSDTLDGLINDLSDYHGINTLNGLIEAMDNNQKWNLKLYYAAHDKQYVAVFS